MANERNISDKIWLVLKGLAMGSANKFLEFLVE